MTNTKFRKRALLSSVAMLLVALVALGSATFAWYQAKVTVTSSGMQFKTDALSGLQIISASVANGNTTTEGSTTVTAATSGWSDTSTTFYTGGSALTLQPASYNAGSWFTTTGTGTTTAAIDNSKSIITPANTRNTYYMSEQVYFKFGAGTSSAGRVDLTGVQITAGEAATMTSAIRVVVTDSTGALVGEYRAAAATEAGPVLKKVTNSKTINAAVADDGAGASVADYYDNSKSLKQGAGAVTAAKVCDITGTFDRTTAFCTVYVYLDGFESDVTSSNATTIGDGSNNILDGITLTFTLTDTSAP